MNNTVSFGNKESYDALIKRLTKKNIDTARFYSDVRNSLKDKRFDLTEDEFKKAIPIAKEAATKEQKKWDDLLGPGFMEGDPIKDAFLLMKKHFGFKTDY